MTVRKLKKNPKVPGSGQQTPEIFGINSSHLKNDANPFNWYIKPYKVDNHPLLYGKQREFRPHPQTRVAMIVIVVSLTSRDLIHQRNLEQISRAVSKYRPKKCSEILSPAFGLTLPPQQNLQKKIIFPLPPQKSNQIPTNLPPNSFFWPSKQNKYLQTPDQNGSQRNQVSCCSFFCACKLSSRSCCLGLGVWGSGLSGGPPLQAGPTGRIIRGLGYVVSNPLGKCHLPNKEGLIKHHSL